MTRASAMGTLESFPLTMKLMLATLASEPFSDPKWLFEPKLRRDQVNFTPVQGEEEYD